MKSTAETRALRALLEERTESDTELHVWYARLHEMLRIAYERDPESYRASWLPILESHSWGERPLARLSSLEAVRRWAKHLAPKRPCLALTYGSTEAGERRHEVFRCRARALARVIELDLTYVDYMGETNQITNDDLSEILQSNIGGIEKLCLSGNALSNEGIEMLAGSDVARNVTHLDIGGNEGVDLEGLILLANSEKIKNLVSIGIGRIAFDVKEFVRRLPIAWTSRLERLYVDNYKMSRFDVVDLIESHKFSSLTHFWGDSIREKRQVGVEAEPVDLFNDEGVDEPDVDEATIGGGPRGEGRGHLKRGARLQSLRLSGYYWDESCLKRETLEELFASGALERVETLELFDEKARGDITGFLSAHTFGRLRRLSILGGGFKDDDIVEIFTGGSFPALESIGLGMNGAGDRGLEAILSRCDRDRLTTIDLRDNQVTSRGLRALNDFWGHSDSAPRLHLNLRGNHLDSEGVEALREAPFLHRLSALYLGRTGISGDDLVDIMSSPSWAQRLHRLCATGLGLESRHLSALLESRALGEICCLNLKSNQLDDESAALLAKRAEEKVFLSLNLINNEIGDEGARALAQARGLRSLLFIGIRGNPMSWDGARSLFLSPHFKECRVYFEDH